jgi:hypothetical protein
MKYARFFALTFVQLFAAARSSGSERDVQSAGNRTTPHSEPGWTCHRADIACLKVSLGASGM